MQVDGNPKIRPYKLVDGGASHILPIGAARPATTSDPASMSICHSPAGAPPNLISRCS